MRIIVAGGRDYNDYTMAKTMLDYYLRDLDKEKLVIVSGGARGADSLGERYARENGYELRRYPANWDKYGKGAGYRRNVQMAENADALVAFPGGKGTEHMINIAKERDLKVRVVEC